MHVFVIGNSDELIKEAPIDFISDIVIGKGGFIKIEPGCSPPKILWTMKSLLLAMGIGFQYATVQRLVGQGMHAEPAEHHVTQMLNNLITFELPPLPSEKELDIAREELDALKELKKEAEETEEEEEKPIE